MTKSDNDSFSSKHSQHYRPSHYKLAALLLVKCIISLRLAAACITCWKDRRHLAWDRSGSRTDHSDQHSLSHPNRSDTQTSFSTNWWP